MLFFNADHLCNITDILFTIFVTDGILNFVMMRKTIDLSWIYHASSKLNSVFIMRLNGISMR